jgi:hypothetical protein
MSRDESALSPTYLAMGMRRQWSDEHVFEPSESHFGCGRCGRRFRHPDHCDRETDKNAVLAIADRIRE